MISASNALELIQQAMPDFGPRFVEGHRSDIFKQVLRLPARPKRTTDPETSATRRLTESPGRDPTTGAPEAEGPGSA